MKKILLLTLVSTLASFGSAALADDTTIWVSKASDSKAKISLVDPIGYPATKPVATIPISFDSGASWDNVKRSYTVSTGLESAIEAKKISISVGTDGTATFHKK